MGCGPSKHEATAWENIKKSQSKLEQPRKRSLSWTSQSKSKGAYGNAVGNFHRIAIKVRDPPATIKFFTEALGYQIMLVSAGETVLVNGYSVVTLWKDEKAKTGSRLTHLALDVSSKDQLKEVYKRVRSYPGVTTESKPKLLMEGPSRHFVFTEPCGNRLEIVYWGGLL
uniref:VOC domain-containing protein n=1 Tax=Lotharella oceanica TaxID=641309 RepID=A0A7S2XE30_9EUKA|mmetsp:Transcript_31012/g.57857  ORF Transcript_31012/g.57857 Transcript_31012/m.57857 type:complete len:169 (+) Transcript_31012:128-634(+)